MSDLLKRPCPRRRPSNQVDVAYRVVLVRDTKQHAHEQRCFSGRYTYDEVRSVVKFFWGGGVSRRSLALQWTTHRHNAPALIGSEEEFNEAVRCYESVGGLPAGHQLLLEVGMKPAKTAAKTVDDAMGSPLRTADDVDDLRATSPRVLDAVLRSTSVACSAQPSGVEAGVSASPATHDVAMQEVVGHRTVGSGEGEGETASVASFDSEAHLEAPPTAADPHGDWDDEWGTNSIHSAPVAEPQPEPEAVAPTPPVPVAEDVNVEPVAMSDPPPLASTSSQPEPAPMPEPEPERELEHAVDTGKLHSVVALLTALFGVNASRLLRNPQTDLNVFSGTVLQTGETVEINLPALRTRAVVQCNSWLENVKTIAKANDTLELATRAFPDDRLLLYNTACAASLRHDTDRALARLSQAVAAGYTDAGFLATDPDLAHIRGHPRFATIVSQLGGAPLATTSVSEADPAPRAATAPLVSPPEPDHIVLEEDTEDKVDEVKEEDDKKEDEVKEEEAPAPAPAAAPAPAPPTPAVRPRQPQSNVDVLREAFPALTEEQARRLLLTYKGDLHRAMTALLERA